MKPAYLAVDLELLVEGELFDEFAVLWLLLHASRFRHPQTGSSAVSGTSVLDAWKEQAQEAGERVLGQLRNGVQQALEALGNGLLQHPDNEALRTQLASGTLSGQELHRQPLRLVYRVLLLFTAENRDLLFPQPWARRIRAAASTARATASASCGSWRSAAAPRRAI